ncbi:MAG TPA: hypothetical protein VFW96_03450, partial [Thermomicrobiales bacterium]|nr:hypothetical protein [Thermomicrobiales bacterium]
MARVLVREDAARMRPAPDPPPASPRRAATAMRGALAALARLLPLALLVVMAWQRRWSADDAFIDFRIVRNLLAGDGPVFNVGERVEAYTNPLWVALLAAWARLGGPLEVGAVVLGLACTALGVLAAQSAASALARRAHGARGAAVALPLGVAVLAVLSPVWDFATSGLETGLVFAWLGGAFWLLTRGALAPGGPTRGRALGIAFALGLGPLIRPDLGVFTLGFLAALLVLVVARAGWRRGLATGALACLAVGAVPGGYELWRMGYFAALVPNTALAKEAGATYWSQGLLYLADFAVIHLLMVPLIPLLVWWASGVRRAWQARDLAVATLWVAPVVTALAHGLYVVRVGGDFMHARLLLPSLFGLLLPVMTVVLPRAWPRGRAAAWLGALGVLLALWALASALWLRPPYGHDIGAMGIADERSVYLNQTGRAHPITAQDFAAMTWAQTGDTLRARAASAGQAPALALDTTATCSTAVARTYLLYQDACFEVAQAPEQFALAPGIVPPGVGLVGVRGNIGVTGYLAGPGVHLVDRHGLSDPLGARLILVTRSRPGHEKLLPNPWIIARYTDATPDPAVGAARAALGCGNLAELQRAITAPLTPARFLRNVRDAWALT